MHTAFLLVVLFWHHEPSACDALHNPRRVDGMTDRPTGIAKSSMSSSDSGSDCGEEGARRR